jgi:hypothetical protein
VKWLEVEHPVWEEEEFLREEYPLAWKSFLLRKQETSEKKVENGEHDKVAHPKSSRFSKNKSNVIFANLYLMLQIGNRD